MEFLKRFFSKPPILFPLVALFLWGMTFYEAVFWWGDSVSVAFQFRPLVMLGYSIFWSAATLFRKWGAVGFVVLTIANVALFLFAPDIMAKRALGDILFAPVPVNLIFAALLLFYFRKMD